ncbi:hypothetical protein DFH07DRAFT_807726 [Mycena maculata]|uniref:Uncharacterized protein n=1 Tax=Mycena maculata TaxID=230809 RepID=A0AAD7NND7_9AGAR|nr:hypothetical protein DFH07DRAFT_807726 [Mycena maculata]
MAVLTVVWALYSCTFPNGDRRDVQNISTDFEENSRAHPQPPTLDDPSSPAHPSDRPPPSPSSPASGSARLADARPTRPQSTAERSAAGPIAQDALQTNKAPGSAAPVSLRDGQSATPVPSVRRAVHFSPSHTSPTSSEEHGRVAVANMKDAARRGEIRRWSSLADIDGALD